MNFIGAHKIKLNVTESTNSSLKELVKKECLPEGSLLFTEWQTDGRGQRDAGWLTEKFKNFTGTYLLKPKIGLKEVFAINLITSLAVKSLVEDYLDVEKDVKIKWPNDILVDGKKIGGILIENQVKSHQVTNSFIGVGLNVNQVSFPSFKRKATSIILENEKEVLLEELTDELSIHIQQFYMLFKTKGVTPLLDLYLETLYLKEEWSEYLIPQKTTLMITGLNHEGLLVLRNDQNEYFTFGIKEIEFLL